MHTPEPLSKRVKGWWCVRHKGGTEETGQTEEEKALTRPRAAHDGIQILPPAVPTGRKRWEAEVLKEDSAKRVLEAE